MWLKIYLMYILRKVWDTRYTHIQIWGSRYTYIGLKKGSRYTYKLCDSRCTNEIREILVIVLSHQILSVSVCYVLSLRDGLKNPWLIYFKVWWSDYFDFNDVTYSVFHEVEETQNIFGLYNPCQRYQTKERLFCELGYSRIKYGSHSFRPSCGLEYVNSWQV